MKKSLFLVFVCSSYFSLYGMVWDYNGNIISPRGVGVVLSANNPQSIFQNMAPLYAGAVNKRFGAGGAAAINFGLGAASAIAVQEDGKIVIAGYARFLGIFMFAITRLAIDGSLDLTFNGTGKQIINFGVRDEVKSIAIQSDGKIVIAGYATIGNEVFAIARLNTNGSLDTTFNVTGKKTISASELNNGGAGVDCRAYGVALQVDGKIIVSGRQNSTLFAGPVYNFAVARLTTEGILDTTFNATGALIFQIAALNSESFAVAIQPDGKIILAGVASVAGINNFAVARVTTAGILDTTFNTTGKKTVSFGAINDGATAITLQSHGKLLVVGYTDPGAGAFNFAITRLLTTGDLDTSFNGTGKQTVDFGGVDRATGIVLQPNDLMVVSGYTSVGNSFALARLYANGSLDPFFNGTGKEVVNIDGGTDVANGMVILSNGSLVLAGSTTVPANDFLVTEILNNYTDSIYALEYPGQGGLLF